MITALLLLLAVPGHAAARPAAKAAAAEVKYSFTLDKAAYFVGEPIMVERSWKNVSKHSVSLKVVPQLPLPFKFEGTPRRRDQIRAMRMPGDEYFTLKPGQTQTEHYQLNPLDGWDIDKPLQPGVFVVRAPYASRKPTHRPGTKVAFPDAWAGEVDPPGARIVLSTLTAAQLEPLRARMERGDAEALVVYALNAGDAAIAPLLARFGKADKPARAAIARALFFLGTDEAMKAFAELALRPDLSDAEKGAIVTRLQGARAPATIPVLRRLLDDPALSKGYTAQADGAHTYVYWVRADAAEGLKALGQTVSECVVLEKVVNADNTVRDDSCSARKSVVPDQPKP